MLKRLGCHVAFAVFLASTAAIADEEKYWQTLSAIVNDDPRIYIYAESDLPAEVEVSIDGIPISCFIETDYLDCVLPLEILPGTYKLVVYDVSKGKRKAFDSALVTVGAAGPAGPQGATGPQGSPGADGLQGPIGLQGPQGEPGVAGLRCWDLNGDGIADDAEDINGDGAWDALDCAGSQGMAGEIGPQGEQGPAGPQGEQGLAGLAGPAGPQGATGPQGTPGADGSQGPIGLQGPQGEPGVAGLLCWDLNGDGIADDAEDINGDGAWDALDCAGPHGVAGEIGPQGEQGPAGPQGEQGLAGLAGPAGPQGATGPQGTPGADGSQGPIGPTGPQGPEGEPGPAGPAGPAGASYTPVIWAGGCSRRSSLALQNETYCLDVSDINLNTLSYFQVFGDGRIRIDRTGVYRLNARALQQSCRTSSLSLSFTGGGPGSTIGI